MVFKAKFNVKVKLQRFKKIQKDPKGFKRMQRTQKIQNHPKGFKRVQNDFKVIQNDSN